MADKPKHAYLKRAELKHGVEIAAYECLKLLDYEDHEGNYDQWTERGISREVASDATEILAAILREHCPTWPSPP